MFDYIVLDSFDISSDAHRTFRVSFERQKALTGKSVGLVVSPDALPETWVTLGAIRPLGHSAG